jgi:hypothetical protein
METDMNWDMTDYVAAAILIAGLVTGLVLAWRLIRHPAARLIAMGGVVLLIAAIWVELATDGITRAIGWN